MKRLLFCVLLLAAAATAQAARKALLIGNGAYIERDLAVPVNDIRLLSPTLEAGGFQVTSEENADRKRFDDLVQELASGLDPAQDDAFFYFGGLGAQVEGENYLLPVGIQYDDFSDLIYNGMALTAVIGRLARGRSLTLFIDAGRDALRIPNLERGLAAIGALPENVFLVMSSAPGTGNEDGPQPGSPFAASLRAQLTKAGLTQRQVFDQMAAELGAAGNPEPWMAGVGAGILVAETKTAVHQSPATEAPGSAPAQPDSLGQTPESVGSVTPAQPQVFIDTRLSFWERLRNQKWKDLVSGTEFIYEDLLDGRDNYQFVSSNLARLQVFGFGIETGLSYLSSYYKNDDPDSLNALRKRTIGSQFNLALGLIDPELFRLVARMQANSLDQSWDDQDPETPLDFYRKVKYSNIGIEAAKSVREDAQNFEVGASVDFVPDETGILGFYDLGQPALTGYLFDPWDLEYLSRLKFKAYLIASNFADRYEESLDTEGLAPLSRPTLIAASNAFLLKAQFHYLRNEFTGTDATGEQVDTGFNQARFSSALHANLGRAVGFDLQYRYESVVPDGEEPDRSHTIVLPSLRFTLVDFKPVLLAVSMDYRYDKERFGTSWAETNRLSFSSFVVLGFTRWFSLTGFGAYRNIWLPKDSIFTVEADGWSLGTSLTLRY
jgi:hypothetical protein